VSFNPAFALEAPSAFARVQLCFLLQLAYSGERGAARAYVGHAASLRDPRERTEVRRILRDEVFHMDYTRSQLERIVPERHGRHLWLARASRLWKGYLRAASAVAGLLGTVVLVAQYFLILPVFALFAKRAARREHTGWSEPIRREGRAALERQY